MSLLASVVGLGFLLAAPALPPPPERHFNDYADLVSAADAQRLDEKLQALEQGGYQVVVAIFPELPSPSLEDFTVRTAQAWGVGDKKLDTGAVLFVFVKDRKSRLEVGYGLEDRIPDAMAKQILDDLIAPNFRAGNYAQGLSAAIDGIAAAIGGTYTVRAPEPTGGGGWRWLWWFHEHPFVWIIAFFTVHLFLSRFRWYRSLSSSSGNWSSSGWSSGSSGSSGSSSSSWSSSSSSSSSSSFSGGGGSFGGGGASGSW